MQTASTTYDLCVIGGGSGGLVAARSAAGFGLRVVLVDDRRSVGGECLFSGCIPSKTLIHQARQFHSARQLAPTLQPALGQIMSACHHAIETIQLTKDNDTALRREGVKVIHGRAYFTGPDSIAVAGHRPLRAKRFIIATGSSPYMPPIAGLDDVEVLTNESIFELKTLPERLLVLGGGPVGVELGQAMAMLGSKVTIVTTDARLLPREEATASAAVLAGCLQLGIEVCTGYAVQKAAKRAGGVSVDIVDRHNRSRQLRGSHLLMAAGRKPNINMELEQAGIAYGPLGITVDDHLRTTNSRVYAIGDCTPAPKFTHVAAAQAAIAVRNACFGGKKAYRPASTPWVTFSYPEVARRGCSTSECAKQAGRTIEIPYDTIDKAIADAAGAASGMIRLHFSKRNLLVGYTVVGLNAAEVAAPLNLAIDNCLSLPELASSVQAYPTYGSGIWERLAAERLQSLQSNKLLRWLAKAGRP